MTKESESSTMSNGVRVVHGIADLVNRQTPSLLKCLLPGNPALRVMLILQTVLVVATLSTAAPHLAVDPPLLGARACEQTAEKRVEECLRPMLSYATTLQSNGLLPLEGVQVFHKLCDLYEEFTVCTKSLGCKSISMEAMDASYGYMCGEGHSLFTQHVDCFAQVEQLEEYVVCKNAATTGVNGLHFETAAPRFYFDKLCSVMQTYLNCSRPIILQHCGPPAWDLVTRVTKDSLQVTMPACDLKPFLEPPEVELAKGKDKKEI